MDNIEAALQDLKLHDTLTISAAARLHKCNRSTLSRRWNGVTESAAVKAVNQQLLSPPQEQTLIAHINRLTELSIPPTPAMVCTFAAEIARKPVGRGWSQRFCKRHQDILSSRYLRPIDRQRLHADNKESYRDYYTLLKKVVEKYEVLPCNMYNIDEKGFMIGQVTKTQRIFTHYKGEDKAILGALQDGSREWITVFGTISADGTAVPPMLIYKAVSGRLQDSWVQDFSGLIHDAWFTSSPTGWTNDDLALEWIERLFDRYTKQKARQGRDWRLLFVDGHGSHLTIRFLDYCYNNRIIAVVYPPHSTHRLQPLDVSLFSPLAIRYSQQLQQHIHDTKGFNGVSKRDFFRLFWPAYNASFIRTNIESAFRRTGIHPFNPDVITEWFKPTPPETRPTSAGSNSSHISASDERRIRRLLKEALDEYKSEETAQKMAKFNDILTAITAQNSVLKHQVNSLRRALLYERNKRKRGKQLIEEFRGQQRTAALIMSPAKIDRLKALQVERESRKEADKAAKLAATTERQLQQQQRKVTLARQKLEREEARQKKRLDNLVKERAKLHQKETAEASRQLAINLQASAKKPRKATSHSHSQIGTSPSKSTAKLAVTSDKPVSTRSRTVRLPERYKD
jgi:hypothetical protein